MTKDQSFGIVPIFIDETGKPHFLVIQHAEGHWAFPKGHKEEGETDRETALRELREETGIIECDILETTPLENVFVIPKEVESKYKPKGKPQEKTVTYFLGKVHDTTVSIDTSSGEIIDYMWLPYETAFERITYLETRSILTQAFQYITGTKL